MSIVELLLRIEWHKTFGYGKPFPELGVITEEDMDWAKDVLRIREET